MTCGRASGGGCAGFPRKTAVHPPLVPSSQFATQALLVGGDSLGARQVIKQFLLPVVIEQKMLDKIVQVRGQYTVVLGYCGEHAAAVACSPLGAIPARRWRILARRTRWSGVH